jgi:hypothetical protein
MMLALWEWYVTRDADGGSAGVSKTRHGAMEALAKALVATNRPRTGRIVPVVFTDPVHKPSYYLRGVPVHTAICDGQFLQWK